MVHTERLILYKNFIHDDIFYRLSDLINICQRDDNTDEYEKDALISVAYQYVNKLIEVTDNYGLEGNLYHAFLAFLLSNIENAFSMSCEKVGDREGSINDMARHDFQIFKQLFDVDLTEIDSKLQIKCFSYLTNYVHKDGNSKVFNKRVRDRICELARKLEQAGDVEEFKRHVVAF
ncbi:MAG: hypothetical protein IJV71_03945 [Lachnospiraceae bacterium]|nr:hypothetical protein [Lachnospiraceae bacterium]